MEILSGFGRNITLKQLFKTLVFQCILFERYRIILLVNNVNMRVNIGWFTRLGWLITMQKIFLIFLLFSPFHLAYAKNIHIYSLDVKSVSHVEVFVNDIPVTKLDPDNNEDTRPVNQYLVKGVNKISLVLTPSVDELTGRPPVLNKDILTEITLMQYPKGLMAGDPSAKQMLSEKWLLKQNDPIIDSVKKEYSINLDMDDAGWQWVKAEKLTLTLQLDKEVDAFLDNLQQIINSGKADEYVSLYKTRIQEQAAAYGLEVNSMMEHSKNIISQRKNDPAMQLVPLNKDEYAFRLVADGRLIDCIAKDGDPVLRAKAGSNGFVPVFYDVKLGKIGGKLVILR